VQSVKGLLYLTAALFSKNQHTTDKTTTSSLDINMNFNICHFLDHETHFVGDKIHDMKNVSFYQNILRN
jgi:hypothetical protein